MYFDQRDNDKKPVTKGEKTFVLAMSAAFILMMIMEIVTNYEPRKLGALLFVIFWVPLLFIHEFGHALMAKVVGWKVKKVVLGIGKVMFVSRLFNAPVEVRSIPLEGFVQIAPSTIEFARIKHALVYFAGPGIELFFVCVIAYMLGGFEQLFVIRDDYTRVALQSFAFAALAGAILNLIPMGITTKEGSTPNDGMGILLCLFSSGMDYEMWVNEEEEKEKDSSKL